MRTLIWRFTFWSVALLIVVAGWAHYPTSPIPDDVEADSIYVNKSERTLTLYSGERPVQTYSVALSIRPKGDKHFEGDRRVPEGTYHIDFHHPGSIAHKALRISYPNAEDRRYAQSEGRDPGGLIEIHGLHWSIQWMGRLHQLFDYTLGCIALTNGQMDEVYDVVPDRAPITIAP